MAKKRPSKPRSPKKSQITPHPVPLPQRERVHVKRPVSISPRPLRRGFAGTQGESPVRAVGERDRVRGDAFSPTQVFSETSHDPSRVAPTPPQDEGEYPPEIPQSALRQMERQFELALTRPKVSVVIANHNNVDALWHCLFSLKTQSYPPFEIILVDNASGDASVPFVRSNYPQVRILECQEDFGPAMGSNLGVKTAQGHLVALLDPETVVTPDWLSRMVKDFQENWPKFGLLVSPLKEEGPAARPWKGDSWTLNFLGQPVEGFFRDPRELFCPGRGAVLFPRFLAPDGPFEDEYFFFRENSYLGWKFRLAHRATARTTEARVFQKEGPFTPEFPEWKSLYYEIRNRWLNLLLFYETGNLLKVLPWVLGEGIFRLVRSLGQGFGPFWATLCAMAWIAFHPRLVRRKRRALQDKRKAPDAQVLRFLSGRVARDGGFLSRTLNFLSLVYCDLVGLEVMEKQE